MHLSPKKGAYPHKDQHDRTCVVAYDAEGTNKKIERGMVVRVNADGQFEVAADASKFPLYLALQNYGDLQAHMAGFFGAGVGPVDKTKQTYGQFGTVDDKFGTAPDVGPKGPAITGIHMDDGDVWQTDMFDESAEYNVGDPLTVAAGRLTTTGASGNNIVGYVTAVPYTRWANDGVDKNAGMEGFMTGALIRVFDFQCGR